MWRGWQLGSRWAVLGGAVCYVLEHLVGWLHGRFLPHDAASFRLSALFQYATIILVAYPVFHE